MGAASCPAYREEEKEKVRESGSSRITLEMDANKVHANESRAQSERRSAVTKIVEHRTCRNAAPYMPGVRTGVSGA
jgi:hypothetical protein